MTSPIMDLLPSFPPHPYTDPFPGNWLAPISNFKKENDDPMHPTSPPYNLEQVVGDRKALCLLPTPPQPPAPTCVPLTPVNEGSTSPIIVNMPTPQSLVVPVTEDW